MLFQLGQQGIESTNLIAHDFFEVSEYVDLESPSGKSI